MYKRQSQSIPLIQSGRDVIGRSQTGTGKTLAFGVPALEIIDPAMRGGCQVLILCPTRELAVQACGEIRKLARFLPGIQAAEVYGGAPMDRQILRLKTANLVVGTPGRVMDHMRRGTLKLDRLKMIVLDLSLIHIYRLLAHIALIIPDPPAKMQAAERRNTGRPALAGGARATAARDFQENHPFW